MPALAWRLSMRYESGPHIGNAEIVGTLRRSMAPPSIRWHFHGIRSIRDSSTSPGTLRCWHIKWHGGRDIDFHPPPNICPTSIAPHTNWQFYAIRSLNRSSVGNNWNVGLLVRFHFMWAQSIALKYCVAYFDHFWGISLLIIHFNLCQPDTRSKSN